MFFFSNQGKKCETQCGSLCAVVSQTLRFIYKHSISTHFIGQVSVLGWLDFSREQLLGWKCHKIFILVYKKKRFASREMEKMYVYEYVKEHSVVYSTCGVYSGVLKSVNVSS